ncbi:MAG: NINE protein [Pannonibacter phragmitetus]
MSSSTVSVPNSGMGANPSMIFCGTCGHQIAATAPSCPKCGAPNALAAAPVSEKSMVAAALLCFFLGTFGIHRFYTGKIGTGILMLLTLGGLGIWSLIDLIMIIVGSYKDKQGLPLRR